MSYSRAYPLRYAGLRYFNAAGSDWEAGLGERHDPETHLIPRVLDVALGREPALTVFGRDYDTPDGTCVRDYVHVVDLCEAHLAALRYLSSGGQSGSLNLGSGVGHSVAAIVEKAREITRRPIETVEGPRREGDPPVLVASAARAEQILGWNAKRSSLDRIIRDAWESRRAPLAEPRRSGRAADAVESRERS